MINIIIGVLAMVTLALSATATVLNFRARVRLQKEMKRLNQMIRNKDSIIYNLKNESDPNKLIFKINNNVDPEELKKNLEGNKVILVKDDIEIEYLDNKIKNRAYESLQADNIELRKEYHLEYKRLRKEIEDLKDQLKIKDRVIKNKEEVAEILNNTLKELKPDLKVQEVVDIVNK